MQHLVRARELLRDFRGESYAFGLEVLDRTGPLAASLGKKAILIANDSRWAATAVQKVASSLAACGVAVVSRCAGSRPNSPIEDVYRIRDAILGSPADIVVAVGGGSTIDAAKAANALASLAADTRDIEPLFGVGKVTEMLGSRRLRAFVAVETAASSASHLTRYSNITDLAAARKKLIIDDALTPAAAVFDYVTTISAPRDLTIDGAFDGMSHCLEVYFGAKGDSIDIVEEPALLGVELIVGAIRDALAQPTDFAARRLLGFGTDLGGLCIMKGSTSGPHLTSFSLVDVTSHGRATALLGPYYAVLFAPAIERQLRKLAAIYERCGLPVADIANLSGRELGLAVACAMMTLPRILEMPITLSELPAFTSAHIDRAVDAARDPAIAVKLQAMPVPMNTDMVDEYMRPLLEAAASGDLAKVPTLKV